ncbi:MAG: heavy metal translocating P-type ATPase [Gammaproteobacteria bacterium]|nr:heavy metal translocating P-type ATPase [Gammaproteobacteria bacterium]
MHPACYHCGLPAPEGAEFSVSIDGELKPMCCPGCQAVAQAIVAGGLTDFYRYRTENTPSGRELAPEFLRRLELYDNPEIQKSFVRRDKKSVREASLILEGITCAACVWLNERHIGALPGVFSVRINYATHRARIRWDDSQIHLSEILRAVTRIGYQAHPYDPSRQQEVLERERKEKLRRIGVAGVLGMQVMMFSAALYAGDFSGMEAGFRTLFHWICLVLTLPVVFYSAQPFFKSAWRDLSRFKTGMDVPVALGISIAFAGSVWTTVAGGGGDVYYDSVVMFVFFLLTGRYFELMARQRGARACESLVQMTPATAARLLADGREEVVAVAELSPGDVALIRPGEAVPADGMVTAGCSSVDESLLTGESLPLNKQIGESLSAGTVNIESPLQMKVEKIGEETLLSHILQLLDRAQAEKSRITRLTDRAAAWFTAGVLLLAGSVAWYWQPADAWLAITLSVLVVTCPCALSLATPAAITAASGALIRHGLVITRGHALETLARATHVVFDKTGTLTRGRLQLHNTRCFSKLMLSECRQRAAALEKHSEHPVAQALSLSSGAECKLMASNVINRPGAGMLGDIMGVRYFVGTAAFIQAQTGLRVEAGEELEQAGHTLVWLADAETIHCVFSLSDEIREGAYELVQGLKQQGKAVSMLTGDHEHAARKVALATGIDDFGFELTPEDKFKRVKALEQEGAVTAMIGDGVNDAPVLAAAPVSIAMGGGAQAARANADMILLTEQLPNLLTGIHTARKTLRIIRQNLLWAAAYNVLALPAAALGFVQPWMAAIGMSASSLLVVANALRLLDKSD